MFVFLADKLSIISYPHDYGSLVPDNMAMRVVQGNVNNYSYLKFTEILLFRQTQGTHDILCDVIM